MSKKKNTLNDLEEFLKLQASSLVTPAPLGEKVSESTKPAAEKQTAPVSGESLVNQILRLARSKDEFYNLIIEVTENLPDKSKEDLLLINTALYLKGGSAWKEVVKEYWKGKK